MTDQPYHGSVPPPPASLPVPPPPPQLPVPPPPQHLPVPPASPSYPGFGAPPTYLGQPRYDGGWPVPSPKKRRRTGRAVTLSLIALAAVAGVTGFIVWQNAAEATFQAAVAQVEQAQDEVVAANAAGTTIVADATAQQTAAATIEQADTEGLLDATLQTTFTESMTALDAALAATPEPPAQPTAAGTMPALPWEREAAAERIVSRVNDARDDIETFEEDLDEVARASATVDAAATDLFGSATAKSDSLITANISAANEKKVAFQRAADSVAQYTALTASSATAVTTYVDAATALIASQQAELDEKAGPLLSARLEVEQFARDLAPGIMLDFDWADVVAGAGGGLSVGGTTHWWMDPGYATITFSNSVAELWGSRYDSMVRALVAHEVGHALTIRCGDLYDWSTQTSIEQWATAWAIVNGYTGEGNGVSVYGQPPESMLQAARGCS